MQTITKTSSWLKVLALSLATANLILWYSAPWLRDAFDATMGRLTSPLRPMVVTGVQELLVYCDPWLARGVFPLVYTLGFAAIAFVFQPDPDAVGTISTSAVLSILLLSLEAVWVFLMAFAILFRGPDWNFYWPWEVWHPKLVPINTVDFSYLFWSCLAGRIFPFAPWVVREAPGLLFAAAYLSLGLLIARPLSHRTGYATAYCCFVLLMLFMLAPLFLTWITNPEDGNFGAKMALLLLLIGLILGVSYPFYWLLKPRKRPQGMDRRMAYWRSVLIVLLVQLAALVPVKMLVYWVFGMKYFIHFKGQFNL